MKPQNEFVLMILERILKEKLGAGDPVQLDNDGEKIISLKKQIPKLGPPIFSLSLPAHLD